MRSALVALTLSCICLLDAAPGPKQTSRSRPPSSRLVGNGAVVDTARERTWIAGRYDATRVVVYLDTARLEYAGLPKRALLPQPKADAFAGIDQLSPSEAARTIAQQAAERFAIDDRYDLILDHGRVATVTLTTLVGFEADEGSGNSSFVGAIATVSLADLRFFTKNYYALRPHDATRASNPDAAAGTEMLPPRLAAAERVQIGGLVRAALQLGADSIAAVARDSALRVRDIVRFVVPQGQRYYLRGTVGVSEHRQVRCAVVDAWLAADSPARVLAAEPTICRYGMPALPGEIVNVVSLGDGRAGLIVDRWLADGRALTLYEYRDSVGFRRMRVLQSIDNGA